MAIDAVIFDIGNVLIEWQPERYYDAAIGPDRRRAFFDAVDLEAMNDRIDRGADFDATVRATADAHPDWAGEIRRWHDNWIEMAKPAIPLSVALLGALRSKGVPCFCLSNFGVETFAYAETQYSFFGDFDRRYISGQIGLAKPDAEIFAHVEADCGLPPGNLLFTDDKAENIAVAEQRGWQVHRFVGARGLADRLVAEGLLTEAEAA